MAVEAENERQKDSWYMMAHFTSILLTPHLRKGRSIKPEMLIPEAFLYEKRKMTKEDARNELEGIKIFIFNMKISIRVEA